MKTVSVIILSGSCCSPSLAGLDGKVQARIKEVAEKLQVQVNIELVTISAAAVGGLGLCKEVDGTIRSLISDKGMSVLPVVLFNGAIAFYGGLASVALVEEKLGACVCD